MYNENNSFSIFVFSTLMKKSKEHRKPVFSGILAQEKPRFSKKVRKAGLI